jgi:hypothetical protein
MERRSGLMMNTACVVASADVGRWNPNGTLSIIDRKKNMLKLSQGEYIALEKVEGCYKNLMTAQVWVYGNSYHSFVVAVVVPDTANCLAWLQGKGWWPSGMEYSLSEQFRAELKKQVEAHLADYKTEVMTAIGNAATANKLSSLEKVPSNHRRVCTAGCCSTQITYWSRCIPRQMGMSFVFLLMGPFAFVSSWCHCMRRPPGQGYSRRNRMGRQWHGLQCRE